MAVNEVFEEDEISLFDLWQTLIGGWRYVLAGAVVGVLAAVMVVLTVQPTYEASALLQAGKVAGAVIEDAATIVERFKSPSFHLEVANDVGDEKWAEQVENGNGTQILSAQVPKTAPSMVEVKVKAKSPDFAKKIADTATQKLIKRQDELSSQVLQKIRFDLATAKEKLLKAENDLLDLTKILSATGVKDERFSQVSLLTSIKLQKESDVFALRQSVFALEISLMPPSTQPARVLEAVYVAQKPVSPKKGLLLALGLMGGLLVGLLSVFVSNAWRRARVQRSASSVPV